MNIDSLLEQLEVDLEKIQVGYQPHKKVAYPGEVCISVGYSQEGGWIYHQSGTQYSTTSELLLAISPDRFPEQRPIEQFRFLLDDLSLDTCFSFILWYVRYHQVELPEKYEDWLDYIKQWEQGLVKSTGDPFSSLGCLHSALAQSFFYEQDTWEENASHKPDQTHFHTGFRSCIRLLIAILLEEEVEPYDIPELDYIPEYQDAVYALQLEYKKYLQSIEYSSLIQLEMPLKGMDRTVLIDAFIGTENTYIGLLKSFLQHDEKRTWLKSGFRLIALYRPQQKGTKNEMLISVDPGTQISLEKLWNRLQEMEAERQNQEVSWNNHLHQHTHLSAPTNGTTLSWQEVVAELWELYNPANSLLVRPYHPNGELGEAKPIYQCDPVISEEVSGKQLIAVKWDSLQTQQIILSSPSIQKYLAVCASRQHTGQLPPVHPLPKQSSFDTLSLPCGLAIIHHEGIFLLDDKNNEELNLGDYQAQFLQLLTRSKVLTSVHQEVLEKITFVQALVKKKRILPYNESAELNSWITEKKLELRDVLLRTMQTNIEHSLLQFRESVEKRWGLNTQIQELYESLKELEGILATMSDFRTNRFINLITIYGFPLALFAGLFEVIFQDVGTAGSLGLNWSVLGIFFVLSILSITVIGFVLRQRDKKNKVLEKEDS